MWFDLQIDLETMGLPPDGAMCSIGACFFDLGKREIGPTFERTINLATAVRDGGTLNPSTIIWWLGQSEEARKSIRFSAEDIRTTLTDFAAFITEHSSVKEVRPWGNSNAFDLTIMGSAYKRAGIPQPWSWSRERDFRTVRNMFPSIPYDPSEKGDGAHNALADAIFQAQFLFRIKDSRARKAD